jgi:CheY-like chemotaxis protein
MKVKKKIESISILLAEDDEDDYVLVEKALRPYPIPITLTWVKDGEALMDYLGSKKTPQADIEANLPHMVMLDLNMPKKNGMEALKEIKDDPLLRKLPIVVFTTSRSDEDMARAYGLEVNWFLSKPVDPIQFLDIVREVIRYWFEVAQPRSIY